MISRGAGASGARPRGCCWSVRAAEWKGPRRKASRPTDNIRARAAAREPRPQPQPTKRVVFFFFVGGRTRHERERCARRCVRTLPLPAAVVARAKDRRRSFKGQWKSNCGATRVTHHRATYYTPIIIAPAKTTFVLRCFFFFSKNIYRGDSVP